MAGRRKPSVKKIKFELTYSGVAGIGIVCFCIFLWMFLLGVWTGQKLLLPAARPQTNVAQKIGLEDFAASGLPQVEPADGKQVRKDE